MLKKLIPCFAFVGLTTACSSAPKLGVPDGRARTPVNSAAAIAEYQAGIAGPPAGRGAEARVDGPVGEMHRQIAELKLQIAALAAGHQGQSLRSEAKAVPAQRPERDIRLLPASLPSRASAPPAVAAVAIKQPSVLFSTSYAAGQTGFKPSPNLVRRLLQAAKDGARMEIRGGADSAARTAANEGIAKARANSAKQYLVRIGVPPSNIRIRFFMVSSVMPDNASLLGAAQKRRVEIRIFGADLLASRSGVNFLGEKAK